MQNSKDVAGTLLPRAFTFNAQSTPVRTVKLDGQPYFVAKDVCDILGLSKYRDAVARMDDDETLPVVVDTLGGPQQMAAVTESGLYHLIFQSRKPEARVFRRWVTSEVLPALRRTGRYALDQATQASLFPDTRARRAALPTSVADFRGGRPLRILVCGYPVTAVVADGARWFSLSGLLRAARSSAPAARVAGRLNWVLAGSVQRVVLFGMGSPAWFVDERAVELLRGAYPSMSHLTIGEEVRDGQ